MLIYVIQFQKRRRPHAHFLIILKDKCKLKDRAKFNQFKKAKIPLKDNVHLRELVLKHMMHGPSVKLNPTCKCIVRRNGRAECK